ncbi:MAG: NAD(P)-dependent oxidoreductase [archaeon]|nr:NAD(P)-dependent oxidoreductase [archaeon]
MKIFVTGSNGFVGKELVNELKKRKISFVEFSRKFGDDINDAKQIEKKMKGCDAVVHLAAIRNNAGDEEIKKINIDATKNVLLAAEKNKVKKFVFLSSIAVNGKIATIIDESTPMLGKGNYAKSKIEAEKLVKEFGKNFNYAILRPPFILGLDDNFKKMVEMIRDGLLLFDGNQKLGFVYVKNLNDAIIFVLKENISGTFVVAQQNELRVKEFYEIIYEFYNKKKNFVVLPKIFSKFLTYFLGFQIKLFKKNLVQEFFAIDRLSNERLYSCKKLSGLGWKQKFSSKESIIDALKELN